MEAILLGALVSLLLQPVRVHYGQGEALIHPYNRGVRAIIRVDKEGVRVG